MKMKLAKKMSDLSSEQLQELEGYVEQLTTIQSYVEGFIEQHELDEDEVYEKIEVDLITKYFE